MSMVRRLFVALVAPVLLLAVSFGALRAETAATITVNTRVDELNSDGDCSLREAIRAANTNTRVDACRAGGTTQDVIRLPRGRYILTLAGAVEDEGGTGDLDIAGSTVISGSQAVVEGGSGWDDRIFDILGDGSISVSFVGLTIRKGDAAEAGGGIRLRRASLLLQRSTVAENQGFNGGGINSSEGTLTLERSSIVSNTAVSVAGGGIYMSRGRLEATNSTISGNRAVGEGGGIIVLGTGQVNLLNLTITNNQADFEGSGGGVYIPFGATIRNTIIAGNRAAEATAGAGVDCRGAITGGGYNLIGVSAGCHTTASATGTILDQPASLGPLRNNGGPTPTHALLAASPALDAGDPGAEPANCPSVDQRGTPRPQDGNGDGSARCDIGAFEFAPPQARLFTVNSRADLVDRKPGDNICRTAARTCTLRAAIQEANARRTTDTISLPPGTYSLTLSGAGEDAAATGDLDIAASTTISAQVEGLVVVEGGSGWDDRIFDVSGRIFARVVGLTIRKGDAAEAGGGIRLRRASLLLQRSTVAENQGFNGGGINSSEGTLSLERSSIISNTAVSVAGGGIYMSRGRLEATNSTISGNRAVGEGGGIIVLGGGQANLLNLTITNNQAGFEGSGGGIYVPFGATIRNTIIAGNRAAEATAGAGVDCRGAITGGGYNLIGVSAGCATTASATGTILNQPAGLGPLRNNGGPTSTHALLAASPALDAADPGAEPANCPPVDQRGTPRPQDGNGDGSARCDIGAFERAEVGISELSPSSGASMPGVETSFTLTWTHPHEWRDLDYLDLRLSDDQGPVLWARFNERFESSADASTFSLLDADGTIAGTGRPGEATMLETETARLSLERSSFTGSGPTGPSVVVTYTVSFKDPAAGRLLDVELLARDDSGAIQGADLVGRWQVGPFVLFLPTIRD